MARKNIEVNSWNEKSKSDHTRGICFEKLPEFIQSLEHSFKFAKYDLWDKFSNTINELANGCDERGLTSTVYGDLDSKTSIFGLFHCAREKHGTLSVFYTVHFLSFELERDEVYLELQTQPGVFVDDRTGKDQRAMMARSAIRVLHGMGVDLNLPHIGLSAEGGNFSSLF